MWSAHRIALILERSKDFGLGHSLEQWAHEPRYG